MSRWFFLGFPFLYTSSVLLESFMLFFHLYIAFYPKKKGVVVTVVCLDLDHFRALILILFFSTVHIVCFCRYIKMLICFALTESFLLFPSSWPFSGPRS